NIVSSVKEVNIIRSAPPTIPGSNIGIKIVFHLATNPAPDICPAASIDESTCEKAVKLPLTCKIRKRVTYAINKIQIVPYIPGFHPGIGSIHVKIIQRAKTVPGNAYGMVINISSSLLD